MTRALKKALAEVERLQATNQENIGRQVLVENCGCSVMTLMRVCVRWTPNDVISVARHRHEKGR
jgi:Fe-S cluster assembly iron-binding protein IscA